MRRRPWQRPFREGVRGHRPGRAQEVGERTARDGRCAGRRGRRKRTSQRSASPASRARARAREQGEGEEEEAAEAREEEAREEEAREDGRGSRAQGEEVKEEEEADEGHGEELVCRARFDYSKDLQRELLRRLPKMHALRAEIEAAGAGDGNYELAQQKKEELQQMSNELQNCGLPMCASCFVHYPA
ncbi:unnamed protein product, partial [Prorocentrum cordatum]